MPLCEASWITPTKSHKIPTSIALCHGDSLRCASSGHLVAVPAMSKGLIGGVLSAIYRRRRPVRLCRGQSRPLRLSKINSRSLVKIRHRTPKIHPPASLLRSAIRVLNAKFVIGIAAWLCRHPRPPVDHSSLFPKYRCS